MVPEDPGPTLPSHPHPPTSQSRGEDKHFSRKASNFLRVDSHRLPPHWPQPGCAPSRQLLAKVFKQCRRPLVALGAAQHKSCHLEEGLLDERGMSPYPQLQSLGPGELTVASSSNTPVKRREQSRVLDPYGRNTGRMDLQDPSTPGHQPLPPALSLLLELRVGSCLSRGWGHTAAAEAHLLAPAGDTFLARRRDIWSAREVPSPSMEPWPALSSASYLKAMGEARVILQ